jgi:hypothetical protein
MAARIARPRVLQHIGMVWRPTSVRGACAALLFEKRGEQRFAANVDAAKFARAERWGIVQ